MEITHIGPYEVLRELGAGGMGTVYLARRPDGSLAAVKVLPASLSREPGFVARFNREIEALRAVKSPHIVELLDSGVDGDTYYYAMEYVEGETLTARLEREKRVPWRVAIDIAVQVCRALKSAHNAGVIHRDLKPSNLLLSDGDQVKLTDFGVAQIFAGGKLTATGGIVGTAEYMSPEQAEGKRATKQSDIYALGAVLYAMLTGRPPFTGKTHLDIAQKHRFGQFDSPRRFVAEVPTWLDEVVCQCLSKNPDQRYPDAYVLSLRLAEIPRKVDLANQDGEPEGPSSGVMAETVAAHSSLADEAGQVGGTFVRDMVRAELERATGRLSIEHWLENTWVLVLLLAVVLAGGLWFYRRQAVDPEQLFAEGEKLLQQQDRAAWLQAEEEHFQPLLAIDPETWRPRVAPYQPQIQLAVREQEILRRLRRRGDASSPQPEPLRVLDRVARDIEAGEIDAARHRLEALGRLLPDDPEYSAEHAVISELLGRLPESAPSRENPLLVESLRRAERLRSEGKLVEAREIWSSLVILYRDDPSAAETVREAERHLQLSTAEN